MAEKNNTSSHELETDHDGVSSGGSTRYTISSADIEMLRDSGVSEDDVAHSLKVAHKALELLKPN